MSNLAKNFIEMKIELRRIMIFAKSNDPDSIQVKQIFEQYFIPEGKSGFFQGKSVSKFVYLRFIRMD
jgi:hypothetical protein